MKKIIVLITLLGCLTSYSQERFTKIIQTFAAVDIGSADGTIITVSVKYVCLNCNRSPLQEQIPESQMRFGKKLLAHIDSPSDRGRMDYEGLLQEFDLDQQSINEITELDYRGGVLYIIFGGNRQPTRWDTRYQIPIGKSYLTYSYSADYENGPKKFRRVIL